MIPACQHYPAMLLPVALSLLESSACISAEGSVSYSPLDVGHTTLEAALAVSPKRATRAFSRTRTPGEGSDMVLSGFDRVESPERKIVLGS
jgi:hypothetical protein